MKKVGTVAILLAVTGAAASPRSARARGSDDAGVPVARAGSAAPQAAHGAPTPREPLIRTWEGRLAEQAEELVRDGHEEAVLAPLARHPVAALVMLGYFRHSDRLLQRKLAPSLARLLGKHAPPETLDEIFEAEAVRRTAFLKGRTTSGEDARMQAVDETAEKLAGRPGLSVYLDAASVVEELRAGRCDEPRNSGAKDGADPLAGWSRSDRAELRAFLVLAASTR